MYLNGKNYELKATGGTLLIYKEEFKKNMLSTIQHLDKVGEDITVAFEIIWALIKTADNDTPHFKEWFNDIPFGEITRFISSGNFNEIYEAINEGFAPTKELKKK